MNRAPEYFNKEIKGTLALSVFAGVTPVSLSIGVGLDVKKSKELEAKVKDMSILVDRTIDAIEKKTDINTSGLNLSEDDKVALIQLRSQIERMYIQLGSSPEYRSLIKEGYVHHYRDTLHTNLAEGGLFGTHFAGMGL